MTTKEEKIDEWQYQLENMQYDLDILKQREPNKQVLAELENARCAARECYNALSKC